MTSSISREQLVLYALLTSLTAMSIDALLPGLRMIDAQMANSSRFAARHLITLFVVGMAFGELALGPLSDAIGRKKVLLLGLALYSAGTLIAMAAGTLEVLVFGRILQGVGVAGPKIATRAMIRDQFEGDMMARVMSFMFALLVFVPMLAPLLGQGVIAVGGWRGLFVAYLMIAMGVALWLIKRQPETLLAMNRIAFQPRLLLGNGMRILGNRRVSLLITATGLVFGAQLLYLSTAAQLFSDAFEIRELFPMYFAILAAGVGIASYFNAGFVLRFGMERMVQSALIGMALVGGAMLVAALIWAGRPPLGLFMLQGFAGFFAIGVLFGNLNAMAMRSLAQLAGLGAALIASGSSLVAALFSSVFSMFYDGSTLYFAAAFFAAAVGALLLLGLSNRDDSAQIQAMR
ncbi:MAG: DHA1 family bicyclomycin/chloramphenicol resistance-like MFS transporter [Halocynthiibacter sp.]|jgi:DHA1 family bicyclomycin/chloramphenicol resistance-like MFS transporter